MPELKIAIVPVTPFQQNCTLIWDDIDKTGVVIDPGGDIESILEAIGETGMRVETILITHGHLDHVGGAMALKERLGVDITADSVLAHLRLSGVLSQPDSWRADGVIAAENFAIASTQTRIDNQKWK